MNIPFTSLPTGEKLVSSDWVVWMEDFLGESKLGFLSAWVLFLPLSEEEEEDGEESLSKEKWVRWVLLLFFWKKDEQEEEGLQNVQNLKEVSRLVFHEHVHVEGEDAMSEREEPNSRRTPQLSICGGNVVIKWGPRAIAFDLLRNHQVGPPAQYKWWPIHAGPTRH